MLTFGSPYLLLHRVPGLTKRVRQRPNNITQGTSVLSMLFSQLTKLKGTTKTNGLSPLSLETAT